MKYRNIVVTVLVAAVAVAGLVGLRRSLEDPTPANLYVPNVVGLSLSKAARELRANQLLVGPAEAIQNEAPTGTVLQQDVQAGMPATPTSVVSLLLSAGPDPKPDNRNYVVVGGTCEVIASPPPSGRPCVGGPLMVRLLTETPTPAPSITATPTA